MPPGPKPGGKSKIVLATHTAPIIPIGEKSRQRRLFQRHQRITPQSPWGE